MVKPMSKGRRGPVDHGSARGPKSVNRKPHGMGKSTHPMTKEMGLAGKGASRRLKGVDRARTGKGHNSLNGKYF